MAKTVFIADLHLDESRPETTKLFLNYINRLETESIDALYVLGDLFEYWIGDDYKTKLTQSVKKAFKKFSLTSPIFFIHGNRDFLLGENYANECGFTILNEHSVIDLYGVKTLIMHGDTLCTDDIDYMEFRNNVRTEKWANKILGLPLFVRKIIAWRMRKKSKQSNKTKTNNIMDVSQETVLDIMAKYSVSQLIHGHTHKANIHHFSLNSKTATRYVVDDWHTKGSAIIASSDKIKLTKID